MNYYVGEWSFTPKHTDIVSEIDSKDYLWHSSNRDHFVKLHGPFDSFESAKEFARRI